MEQKFSLFILILAVVIFIGTQSLFTVDQRQQAIVLQLGEPIGTPRAPGIHLKVPLIQTVRYFDKRILSVDPPAKQMVISSEFIEKPKEKQAEDKTKDKTEDKTKNSEDTVDAATLEKPKSIANPVISNVSGEPIIVDTFARYQITDPLQFLKTLGTTERANSRIENIVEDSTRSIMGKTSLGELLSNDRDRVMASIRRQVNRKIAEDSLGIEIVDVRIVRADLTADLRDSTVRRMISELRERATETRAKGEEQAKRIRSTAEKERTVILANAQRDAQILRGEGDKEAIKIYADAFNKDKEFYAFLRSMEAYKNTLADPETRLILSPDSAFFKYFKQR